MEIKKCPKCGEVYHALADTCPKCNIDLNTGKKVEPNTNIDLKELKKEYKRLRLCLGIYLAICFIFILGLVTHSVFMLAILLVVPLNIIVSIRIIKIYKIMGESIIIGIFFYLLFPMPMIMTAYWKVQEILKQND